MMNFIRFSLAVPLLALSMVVGAMFVDAAVTEVLHSMEAR